MAVLKFEIHSSHLTLSNFGSRSHPPPHFHALHGLLTTEIVYTMFSCGKSMEFVGWAPPCWPGIRKQTTAVCSVLVPGANRCLQCCLTVELVCRHMDIHRPR